MLKQQLRNKYLKERLALTEGEVEEKSLMITNRVLHLAEVKRARNVCLYLPTKNEVDTKKIINHLISEGKKVFLPANARQANTRGVGSDSPGVSKVSMGYAFAEFTGWQNLEKGPFGILQPIHNRGNKPGLELHYKPGLRNSFEENIDLAIIPGVAFDKHGVRLGYGKGVFDKLLADSKAFKIGLAYDFQIVDELPREKHDLVMDFVVTESRVIRPTTILWNPF